MNTILVLPVPPHGVVRRKWVATGFPACAVPHVKPAWEQCSLFLSQPVWRSLFIANMAAERVGKKSIALPPFSQARAFCDHCLTGSSRLSFVTTLTSPSICSYGEAFWAGAIIGSHGIVADLGAGTPSCTFIFIWNKKQKGPVHR